MDLYTVNWGYGARAFLADTRFDGAWSEEHELTETDISAEPSGYSEYSLDLTVVATIGEVGEAVAIAAPARLRRCPSDAGSSRHRRRHPRHPSRQARRPPPPPAA